MVSEVARYKRPLGQQNLPFCYSGAAVAGDSGDQIPSVEQMDTFVTESTLSRAGKIHVRHSPDEIRLYVRQLVVENHLPIWE
jgi:hypothetical protein